MAIGNGHAPSADASSSSGTPQRNGPASAAGQEARLSQITGLLRQLALDKFTGKVIINFTEGSPATGNLERTLRFGR